MAAAASRVSRHFVALVPPPSTLVELGHVQERMRPELTATHLRWTPADNLHVTLHFFGRLLEEQKSVDRALSIMSDVAKEFGPLEIEAQKLTVYPKWSKPRVVRLHFTLS